MTIPDLNVLLYAVDRSSAKHEEAKSFLERLLNDGRERAGLPWAVHLGFLRLTTSPKVFARPLSIAEACAWLDGFRAHPAVTAVDPGPAHAGILRHLLLASGTGGNLTTDAHIAALALERDATVATGDRDFARFPGLKTLILF